MKKTLFLTLAALFGSLLAGAAEQPAENAYVIVVSAETATQKDWGNVVKALLKERDNAKAVVVKSLSEDSIAKVLRKHQARYAAVVVRPQEATRELVNNIHRAARRVDDDPWGDCMWGIVTGAEAKDALRVARDRRPLVIKRALGTTNIDASRFEHSCCITDWTGFPVLEQSGYTEPVTTTYTEETEEGRNIVRNGIQGVFAKQLEEERPQLIVTSSHATQFNLEMPFSKGLIFPARKRFYPLPAPVMNKFVKDHLMPIMGGRPNALAALAAEEKLQPIAPDGERRVWLAAGNCLFGDAHGSPDSMAVTAISGYTCNQLAGYTVPSWYGKAGWGTLGTFFGNAKGTTLAQAAFLNNQFLLHETMQLEPKLLSVRFNDAEFVPAKLIRAVMMQGITVKEEKVQDYLGLVHDRDALAFYGDPQWRACLDDEHGNTPGFSVTWQSDTEFTITADHDAKGRCGIWFPKRLNAKSCTAPNAVLTNDFILFPELDMKQGETMKVKVES